MGGVCGIGSIKGRLSPIGSLQGALSIPVGGSMDCDIYEGEYNITPNDTVQVLPTANKLLKHDASLLVVPSALVGAPISGRLFLCFTSYFIFSISSFSHSNSL